MTKSKPPTPAAKRHRTASANCGTANCGTGAPAGHPRAQARNNQTPKIHLNPPPPLFSPAQPGSKNATSYTEISYEEKVSKKQPRKGTETGQKEDQNYPPNTTKGNIKGTGFTPPPEKQNA